LNNKLLSLCLLSLALGAGLFVSVTQNTQAQPGVTWPQISLTQVVAGLEAPVHLTHVGDGSGRLFVIEQRGRILILKNGVIEATFLDISGRVRSPFSTGGSEEGLLSVAFPPDFASGKDYFYVYYTNLDGDNQVSRFYLDSTPNTADPQSEQLILLLNHPRYQNHNGGQLSFGPDGYLYIGTGDGGGGGDPDGNAQDPASLLGKLLRIDVEFRQTQSAFGDYLTFLPLSMNNYRAIPGDQPYAIPADNPFVGVSGYREEIWALGLRNPWRFSFDRLSGDLFIGDVGQNSWEEIDFQSASSQGGENYGWNIMEGFECYGGGSCDKTGLTLPVFVYQTDVAGCAVTGGYVYRGQTYPGMQGIYFLGDYCSGKLWGLQPEGNSWSVHEFLDTLYNISSFGEDESGELFLVDRGGGSIYQIVESAGGLR